MESPPGRALRSRLSRWVLPLLGLASLVWFLIRVVPKPSRAAYPCQRAAFPLASGFVLWVVGVLASGAIVRRLLRRPLAGRTLAVFGVAAGLAGAWMVTSPEAPMLATSPDEVNAPIGTPRGAKPGRVVWVHDPRAVEWEGYEADEHWWDEASTDAAVVREMADRAVTELAGEATVAAAWDALFRAHQRQRGLAETGYAAGEKIMVKLNLTTCNARGNQVDLSTYDKKTNVLNRVDSSPHIALALLGQLVDEVGVAEEDITIGDPVAIFPNFYWNIVHPAFPGVRCVDNYGGSGRRRVEFSTTPFGWSSPEAEGARQDYVPSCYAEATYVINHAVLKSHRLGGITLCAKNHYGSLLRCPDGFLRDEGYLDDYFHLHEDLPREVPGRGHYRPQVDLMGHPDLGGKTVLCLVDGLFAGHFWEGHPEKWEMPPFGGGTEASAAWPASILVSQDPVAIDSVGHDFLLAEWPDEANDPELDGGADDYLEEAALASDPPSGRPYDPDGDGTPLESLGVHEHWDGALTRRYAANLGTGAGIELVPIRSDLTVRLALDAPAAISCRGEVRVLLQSSGPVDGLACAVAYDPERLEVEAIVPGAAWAEEAFVGAGATGTWEAQPAATTCDVDGSATAVRLTAERRADAGSEAPPLLAAGDGLEVARIVFRVREPATGEPAALRFVGCPGAMSPAATVTVPAPGGEGGETIAAALPAEPTSVAPAGVCFRRADVNGDGTRDLSDAVAILLPLFLPGPVAGNFVTCPATADTNDDAGVDISDAIYILAHLFLGGPPPPAPYPECGGTTTPGGDGPGCERYEGPSCAQAPAGP